MIRSCRHPVSPGIRKISSNPIGSERFRIGADAPPGAAAASNVLRRRRGTESATSAWNRAVRCDEAAYDDARFAAIVDFPSPVDALTIATVRRSP